MTIITKNTKIAPASLIESISRKEQNFIEIGTAKIIIMNNANRKTGTNLWFHKSKFWQAYISYTDKNFTHKFYAQSI